MWRYIILWLTLITPTAPDPNRRADPLLEEWYKSLKQNGSDKPCCSIADCREVPYDIRGGHYWILVENKWWKVEDSKILTVANPTGHAVACYLMSFIADDPIYDLRDDLLLYCFIKPPGA